MTTDIRFYHLERQSLDQVLPSLLQKALEGGHRIVVRAANDHEVERLNAHLWSYNAASFLPHGAQGDKTKPEDNPIWITDKDENPNQAGVLILTGGASTENITEYKMCCEIFNGHDPEALSAARAKWKSYKDEADLTLTYWQQGERGWEKKSG